MTHRKIIYVFKYLNVYNGGEKADLLCVALQVKTKLNSVSFDRAFAESQGDLAKDSSWTTERDPLICREDQADASSALHQGSRLGQSHPHLWTPQWGMREEGRHYWDFGGQPKGTAGQLQKKHFKSGAAASAHLPGYCAGFESGLQTSWRPSLSPLSPTAVHIGGSSTEEHLSYIVLVSSIL